MMTRCPGILLLLLFPLPALAQGGDQQLRAQAAVLFAEQRFAEVLTTYSQLVSLAPGDRDLNFRYGTCLLHGGEDKEKAIGHLKFAVEDPGTPPLAWYWLGRAHHLNYRFADALTAYQRYKGIADRKTLGEWPVDALERQARNGRKLLTNLKEVTVRNKVEAVDTEFFRFYDLSDIGGRIVVMPDELKTALDRKSKRRALVYLPDKPGAIYYSSYGKDGKTGLDIYRTGLMPDGRFSPPVKLAGYINTDDDEDFPFMHPDGKTFYFSSTGHSSMGGFDVFKAAYDGGMDAFGRPENLDFAVNTPDDDIFYVTDPGHQEACFASGRSSRQGKLHVYRVSTQRMPLIITVLKGTYASEFDATDRRARIVVEDALTREEVTDVRTDMNGDYVLALPRSGRFRFLVDCGPSGKTHIGQVDLPRSDGPKAYRQELSLTRTGDLEKLVIRNYFDTPLEDDLIALALDEIKRRARLDVTPDRTMAEAGAAPITPAADLMTRAGFTGDIDQDRAMELAGEDAAELDRQTMELDARAKEAWTIALDAVAEAEIGAQEAAVLLEAAASMEEGSERDQRMTEAARLRQRSREAGIRARAAQRTAQDLETEELTTRQEAAAATRLATDLRNTLTAAREDDALKHLTALKQRLDVRNSATAQVDITERTRRAAADQEREAARALQQANAKRGEENEVIDRIARLKREQGEARSKSRRDQLTTEITQLEEQLGHLRKQTEAAFVLARSREQDAALMRGQSSLTRHLDTTTERGTAALPEEHQLTGLATRIASAQDRIEALPIDDRFDAMIASSPAEAEARTFDWDLATAAGSIGGMRGPTEAAVRGTNDALQAEPFVADMSRRADERPAPAGAIVGTLPMVQQETELQATETMARTERAIDTGTMTTIGSQAVGTSTSPRSAGVTIQSPTTPADLFLLENERNESQQLAVAERNRSRRDSLERRVAELDRQLAQARLREAEEAPEVTATDDPLAALRSEVEGARPQDPVRVPLVFGKEAKAGEIIERLFADYAGDKIRLEALPDADERAAALQGLELMLADSLRAEMALQVTVLELDPQQADRVLPRVDRLRQMREEHLRLADEHIRRRQEELEALTTMAITQDAPDGTGTRSTSRAVGRDPIMDRFIAFEEEATKVYTSHMEHRSGKVADAVAFKEADLARIESLSVEIDSLVREAAGKPRKDYDKLHRNADRLRDEQLIISTDMGQRSAFISREEWRVATDSLKGLEKAVGRRGLPPSEPLLLMAQGMKGDAQRQMDQATELRKRADRIDDIMERDSLYRTAYGLELQALREVDRSLTVNNHLLGDAHARGETLAYEQVAMKVFGITEVMLAQARDPMSAGKSLASRTPGTEQGTTVPPALDDRAEAILAEARRAQAERSTAEAEADLEDDTAEREVDPADPMRDPEVRSAAPVSAVSAEDRPTVERARASAEKEVEVAAQAAADQASEMLKRFEQFLKSDQLDIQTMRMEDLPEPHLLDQRAIRARADAADLEQRSLELADRATVLADSAATIRNKGRRVALERLAVRTRAEADSLMAVSILRSGEALTAARQQFEAEEQAAFRERLMKFYYLSGEEQQLVLNDIDRSRYFQAKTRALEQYDAATEADAGARSIRELAGMLRSSAPADTDDVAQKERAKVLVTRADAFLATADSLDNIAARLRAAAAINESQAAVLLQGLPGEDPSELMALEMRARRAEPLLAEAYDEAGPQRQGTAADQKTGVPATDPAARQEMAVPASEPVARLEIRDTAPTPAPFPATVDPPTGPITPADGVAADRPAVADVPKTVPAAAVPFRMPDELVSDIFELRAEGSRRAEPIPIDAGMPAGLVFKVQIGAFRRPVPQEAFSDMSPVTGERLDNGIVRYTAGLFTGFEQANAAKGKVRDRGYRDAFVVAYLDGQRIPLGEAMRRSGAVPAVATVPATAMPDPPTPVATIERPVSVPPTAERAADLQEVLAAYPAEAEAIMAAFTPTAEATTYYNVPGAAPARQVETIQGLFFTVQVGVYSRPVALDKLFNITPLNSERIEGGKIRYTTGIHLDLDAARTRREQAVTLGVKDAFVTAYLNGRRVPMREATALMERFGPAILARP